MDGCLNYTVHNESWRNINSNSTVQSNSTSCDAQFLMSGWHRFTGAAGNMLYNRRLNSTNRCGTEIPGWSRGGSKPTGIGRPRLDTMAFRFPQYDKFGLAFIKNCGDFFTYKFVRFPDKSCSYGVCIL